MAGLLDDISEFIGGSTDPKTMDASGLTQADRRQALFGGLTDLGAKLMAAGEPQWGPDRARILASIGNVPAGMAQMRSTIAQQRLLGIKSADLMQQFQQKREFDEWLKVPANQQSVLAALPENMRALALADLKLKGPGALITYMQHADQAALQRAQAEKAQAETGVLRQQSQFQRDALTGQGVFAPGTAGPAPAAPAPTTTTPVVRPPGGPGLTLPATGEAGANLTTPQQTLMAPPSPVTKDPSLVGPPKITQGDVPESPVPELTPTPDVAGGAEAALPKPPVVQPNLPTNLANSTRGPGGQVLLPPGYGAARTLPEVMQNLTPAQRMSLAAIHPSKFAEELAKFASPETKPVFHVPTGQMIFVNKNAPPHPDFAPPEQANWLMRNKEYALKAANDAVEIDPATGKPRINETKMIADVTKARLEDEARGGPGERADKRARLIMDLAEQGMVLDPVAPNGVRRDPDTAKQYLDFNTAKKAGEAQVQAEAQQVERQRTIEEKRADIAKQQADITAAQHGLQPKGGASTVEASPAAIQTQAQLEEARSAAALKAKLAEDEFRNYNAQNGPRAAAVAATQSLPLIHEARQYLKEGMLTGSLPEIRSSINRFLATAGMAPMDPDVVSRTAYDQTVGRAVLATLQYGRPLGSGNSITNEDRKRVEQLSGQGSFSKEEIKEILSIGERTAQRALDLHKAEVDRISKQHPLLREHLVEDAKLSESIPSEADTQRAIVERRRREREGGVTIQGGTPDQTDLLQRFPGRMR